MRRYLILSALVVMVMGAFAQAPAAAQAQSSLQATVTNASKLNVRTAPTTAAGVIAIISRGSTYDVIGRTTDSSWWLISLPPNGIQGWASGRYLNIPNAHLAPVLAAPQPIPAGYVTAAVTANALNYRVIPDPINGAILGRVHRGDVLIVSGRNSGSTRWYQISLPNGTSGWVSGRYVDVTNGDILPVTYDDSVSNPPPVQATGTVIGAYFLNVRMAPNPFLPNILAVISRGQTFPVIGRNAAGTWYQLRLPTGVTGWVNGRYLSLSNAHNLPITG